MKTIQGDVNLTEFHFKEIPEILKDVHIKGGSFYIAYNKLKSLNNSPSKVDFCFNCSTNRNLKSLVGGPKEVGQLMAIDCSLTTLEGFPKILPRPGINGRIDISYNKLTSLIGLPEKVNGSLDIQGNPLKSLEGCSKEVEGDFEAVSLPITNMIGGPEIVKGNCFLNETELNSLQGFPKYIGGNLFIGDTPFWTDLKEKTGSNDNAKRLMEDLLKSVKCKLDGDIFEDDMDYENQEVNMNDYDVEPNDYEYEQDEFGRYRRV